MRANGRTPEIGLNRDAAMPSAPFEERHYSGIPRSVVERVHRRICNSFPETHRR
jgi:hypothetical protein